MSCGKAASALFVNCLVAKLWMTALRIGMMGQSKEQTKKTMESKDFKIAHMAQLNNSEVRRQATFPLLPKGGVLNPCV
jgi:hypothetical protein